MNSSFFKYPFHYCLGLVLLVVIPSWLQADVPLDRIIAIVNNDVIMQSELEKKLRTVRNQIQQQGARLPPPSILEKQVLDNLIQNKLQIELAERTGIKVNDESLNRTISNIAFQNNVTLTEFREILESDGINYEQFREDIRNEIIISRLRKRNVENRITVSDREIDNFLANQEFQGNTDTEIRLSHILIALPEGATKEEIEQTKLMAESVREDAASGKDFAELAKTISDSGTAEQGGDLGWRKISQIPSLFSEYIPNMTEGDVSEPIQSPGGFHIIKLTEARTGEKTIVEQTHARHILIKVDQLTSSEDAKKRLDQLRIRLEGGDDFATLARAHSNDPVSAINGGDLGWASPGQFVPEFEQAMNKLKPGEFSDPFKSSFGWHIMQVIERRQHDNTESVKRAGARSIIHKRKLEEVQQNWLRTMRDEAYVEYRLE